VPVPEERRATLDLAGEELRALLSGVTALAAKEIEAAREGPVFVAPPSAERLHELLDADGALPDDGESLEALLDMCASLLAAGRRTAPTFFGYIQSPPSPVGIAADLLASAADQNVTAWRSAPAATQVERITLRWLGRFVGFSDDAAGIMVGGGSAANLTALLVAVRTLAGPDADRRSLTVYVSQEGHFSIAKAAAALGLAVRRLPVDDAWRLDVDGLRKAVAADRREGRQPLCVVASAGTTATGAVDPLDTVAEIAAEQDLWFHVDGAYGAPAAAVPRHRPLFRGIERADSLAVDAHKWLYAPVDCSALLVRDPGSTSRAFGSGADDYVRVLIAEAEEAFVFWDHGLELSRRFRALKLWMTMRFYGGRRLADTIAEDILMTNHLGELVRRADDLELLSPPSLSVCCFRHVPPGMSDSELDLHNERILAVLQRDGRAYLSNASIGGHLALRACITNFRTTRADVAHAVDVVRAIGARLTHQAAEPA